MMPADITRLLADGSLGDPPTLPGHPSPEALDHPCRCGACLALRREVFTGASGEQLGAFHDEDGARLVSPFRNSHLPAAEARRLGLHLLALADQAEAWMRQAAS